MRKVAPLIIFEWIQFSEITVAIETTIRHEALLAKQNWRSHGKNESA